MKFAARAHNDSLGRPCGSARETLNVQTPPPRRSRQRRCPVRARTCARRRVRRRPTRPATQRYPSLLPFTPATTPPVPPDTASATDSVLRPSRLKCAWRPQRHAHWTAAGGTLLPRSRLLANHSGRHQLRWPSSTGSVSVLTPAAAAAPRGRHFASRADDVGSNFFFRKLRIRHRHRCRYEYLLIEHFHKLYII